MTNFTATKKKKFFAKNWLKNDQFWEKQQLNDLSKKIVAIIIFNLIGVIVISKLILETKIYVPGFFWISQTIVYKNEAILARWSERVPFDLQNFLFFTISFVINLFLAIPAYFLIGKNYTKLSVLCFFTWTVFGVILSLKVIQSEWRGVEIFNFDIVEARRTKQIGFYIIAFFAGICSGYLNIIIWRYNITAGGLDFIYTYLAIKKKKEIHKISLPITIVTLVINILINEVGTADFNVLNFISLLIASVLLMQTRNIIINYLYPKYKITTVMIITKKREEIVKKLKTFYKHGGNIIETCGLYKNEKKEIIITAMTYLEKNQFIKIVTKIDKEAFFVGLPTHFIEGQFNFLNN